MQTDHHRDIRFTVQSELYEHGCSVHFKVYEILGYCDSKDGPPCWGRDGADNNGDFVESLDEAQVFLNGFVKWDGCSNWTFVECERNVMIHFCSPQEAINIGELFRRLYGIANELMGEKVDGWEDPRKEDA